MICKIFPSLSLWVYLVATYSHGLFANAANAAKENEVKSILQQMETDVLAFRDEMERVYGARCEVNTLTECADSNFNDCSSVFPDQQCMNADELVIATCGDGKSCNALWDKHISTVSLPATLAQGSSRNPDDDEVIESACYSRLAEQYMMNKYKADEEYWAKYNVQPSWTYFGAHNGLFRKIPSTLQEECGQYDPRTRPWFVAASSGPKDVVLVIDVSGSMDDYRRIDLAKEAAITVVDTLTVADRVAIVAFSNIASQIGGYNRLIRATNENKQALIQAIKNLYANGATNFYEAFNTAFDTLDRTVREEATSGCNIAILFLTDGQISQGEGAADVIRLVNDRTDQLAANFNRNTILFTFSLGYEADHYVTRSIACDTGGVWAPIDDRTGDLVTAMSSYYKLFALGLGEGGNEDFVAWVEPYAFANPVGKKGTTVSAPVYDRFVKPPLFLGVVGVDIYMDALEQVLGEDATSSTMLQRFVLLSTARCPEIELTECELDALRFLGGKEQATCGVCSSNNYTGIVPKKCPSQSDLPNNLWENTDNDGKKYEDRACCESGGVIPSKSCPIQKDSDGAIIGIVIGVSAALFVTCFCCCYLRRQAKARKTKPKRDTNEQTEPEFNVVSPYEGTSVMVPPSAPSTSPYFDGAEH